MDTETLDHKFIEFVNLQSKVEGRYYSDIESLISAFAFHIGVSVEFLQDYDLDLDNDHLVLKLKSISNLGF